LGWYIPRNASSFLVHVGMMGTVFHPEIFLLADGMRDTEANHGGISVGCVIC